MPRRHIAVRCPRRGAGTSRLWVGVLLAGLWSTACAVTLISHYDEQIDRAATELQRRMDMHLTTLESASGSGALYPQHADFYRDYAVDLRAVELRASTHPKNSISLQQYELMRTNLEDLRSTHEVQNTLSAAYVRQVRALFNQAWQAIIQLEVAKKRNAS